MKTARPVLSCLSLLFLAGTIVLLVLLIIAGTQDRNPLDRIFWLEADTSGIPNAPDGIAHWTLYNYCDERNGLNHNCRSNKAAYPFDPVRNFRTEENVPRDFINNSKRYFYLSRFLYAFYIISLFFALAALLTGLAAVFSKLGGYVSALLSAVTLFCVTFSASIMTACFVLAQKAFHREGRFAKVGVKAFAFTWTTVALTFLSTILFCLAALAGRRRERERYPSNTSPKYNEKRSAGGMMSGRFRRKGANNQGYTEGYRDGTSYESQRPVVTAA